MADSLPAELSKICELDSPADGDVGLAAQYVLQLHARLLCSRLALARNEHELQVRTRRHNQWADRVSKSADTLYKQLNHGNTLADGDESGE